MDFGLIFTVILDNMVFGLIFILMLYTLICGLMFIIISWVTNYSLIFSALIYNFTCEITNGYGNVSYISVPRWRPGLKMLWMKKFKALKDAAENLNT